MNPPTILAIGTGALVFGSLLPGAATVGYFAGPENRDKALDKAKESYAAAKAKATTAAQRRFSTASNTSAPDRDLLLRRTSTASSAVQPDFFGRRSSNASAISSAEPGPSASTSADAKNEMRPRTMSSSSWVWDSKPKN